MACSLRAEGSFPFLHVTYPATKHVCLPYAQRFCSSIIHRKKKILLFASSKIPKKKKKKELPIFRRRSLFLLLNEAEGKRALSDIYQSTKNITYYQYIVRPQVPNCIQACFFPFIAYHRMHIAKLSPCPFEKKPRVSISRTPNPVCSQPTHAAPFPTQQSQALQGSPKTRSNPLAE